MPVRISHLGLIALILIWGTSPTVVRGFKDVFAPEVAASVVILIAFGASLIFCLLKDRRAVTVLFQLNYARDKSWLKLPCMALLAFVIYPVCYFYGLHVGEPLQANAVNYLWPVIAVVAGGFLSRAWPLPNQWMALAIAFLGAVVATDSVMGLGGFRDIPFLWVRNPKINPYLLALGAALCYGLYTALIARLKMRTDKGDAVPAASVFLLLLGIASVFHLLLIGGAALHGGVFLKSGNLSGCVYLLVYALVNLSLGHFLWLHVVSKEGVFASAVTVYAVPIVSTLVLAVFVMHGVSNEILSGLALILIGVFLGRSQAGAISPLAATVSVGLAAWALSYQSSLGRQDWTRTDDVYLGVLQALISMFAIFGGFVLARTIQKNKEQQENFLKAMHRLGLMQQGIDRGRLSPTGVKSCALALMDEYALSVSPRRVEAAVCVNTDTDSRIQALREAIQGIESAPQKEFMERHFDEFRQALLLWRHLRNERVSRFEWVIFLILSGVMIVMAFALASPPGGLFSLGRAAIVTAVMLTLIALADYDRGRPGYTGDYLAATQKSVSFFTEGIPYLPSSVVTDRMFSFAFGRQYPAIYSHGENGRVHKIHIRSSYVRDFQLALWLSVLILCVAALRAAGVL